MVIEEDPGLQKPLEKGFDMVVHSAYIIHAAPMNEDASQRFRLSTDIRYQRVRDAIDPRWTNHWSADDML